MKKEKFILYEIFSIQFLDLAITSNTRYDIVMPIFNTNSLFKQNLLSIYKYIPINRLLIGDAGCTDDSLEVLKDFPRVEIINHKHYKTSGVCVADLIKRVETKHFFYLHSDIFIQDEFVINNLLKHKGTSDWIEGYREHITIVFDDPINYYTDERSFSGIQLGEAALLKKSVEEIEDGHLQRNEDIVIAEKVKINGGKFLKVKDSVHLHQIMNKDGLHEPKFANISIKKKLNIQWEISNWQIQIKGIVLHTIPKKYLIEEVRLSIFMLVLYGALDVSFLKKISIENPNWEQYLLGKYPSKMLFSLVLRNLLSKDLKNLNNSKFSLLKLLLLPIKYN
jgi:hypothetical protein